MFWFVVGQLLVLTAPGCFIPVILALTPGRSGIERVKIAFVACFVAALVQVIFALSSSYVLEFFGFSISAFKIASGTYLMIVSLGLLFDAAGDGKPAAGEMNVATKEALLGVAITPLGIPLLAGPGMISVIVTRSIEDPTLHGRLFLGGAIVTAFTAFFAIVAAAMFGARYIGKFALDVAGKFTGVYAAAVGFLACFSGVSAFIGG
ncbi:MAG: hypothetical protein LBF26_01890 [Puniceicoccales bacterium]|nr:hypothetical protein [Puniceicoccales bacterium]